MASDGHAPGNQRPSLFSPLPSHDRVVQSASPSSPSQRLDPVPEFFDDAYMATSNQEYSASNFVSNPTSSASTRSLDHINPALLLNPKGRASSPFNKNVAANKPTNGTGSAGHLDFQFSSPNDTASAGAPSSQFPQASMDVGGDGGTYTNGFENMIERANNVEQRISAPHAKRRKLENGDNGSPKPSSRDGGSGMLGQYVKGKREEAARTGTKAGTSPGRVEMVDLTSAGG